MNSCPGIGLCFGNDVRFADHVEQGHAHEQQAEDGLVSVAAMYRRMLYQHCSLKFSRMLCMVRTQEETLTGLRILLAPNNRINGFLSTRATEIVFFLAGHATELLFAVRDSDGTVSCYLGLGSSCLRADEVRTRGGGLLSREAEGSESGGHCFCDLSSSMMMR